MNSNHIFLGILATLLLAIGITSCKPNEIIPNDVKAFYVVTTPYMSRDSVFENGQLILFRPVGEVASFLDASRGVQQRSWFINGGDVLNSDNDQLVEGDSLVQVQYNTPGMYTVRLVASLDSSDLVYYETVNDTVKDASGNVLTNAAGGDSIKCLNCKLLPFAPPGSLDTTFTIQVFDSIQADFVGMQNGVASEIFEAGVPVTFVDESKGTPYNWEWTLRGSEPNESEDESPEVVWKKSGTYRVTMRVSRPYIEGDARREQDVITKEFEVMPSTAPLEFLSSTASSGGDYIDLSFNQPLVEVPDLSEFTVEINGGSFGIFKVSFPNSSDSSILRLELDGSMPASSRYSVVSTLNIKADGKSLNAPVDGQGYFKGDGNLFPEGFGDMEGVTSVGLNVLPNTTRNTINGLFTSGPIYAEGDTLGSQTFWKRPFPLRFDKTLHTEAIDATDHVLFGVYSMKWTPGDGAQLDQHPGRGPSFSIEEGKSYVAVIWMKAEGGTGDVTIQIKKGGGVVHEEGKNLVITDGEWTRVAIPYVGAESAIHNFKFFNNAPGVNYYVDEVGVYEQE